MCGLFGKHKNHEMATGSELKTTVEELVKKNKETYEELVEKCESDKYSNLDDFFVGLGKKQIEFQKNNIQKIYEVGLTENKEIA